MKYSLEILSNEKFLLNFLFDLLLAAKISLKKYWYIFIFITTIFLIAGNYHYNKQSKVFYLRSTFRLGSILTPKFGTGVISLTEVGKTKFGRKLLEENFGLSKKDFMSSLKRFLGGVSFVKKTTGERFNYISAFEYSPTSAFISISGEGTDKKELISKYNDLMEFIFSLYNTQRKVKNTPLLARRDLLLEEKKLIDKEYADLLVIEKDFGFTSEVEEKKDNLSERLLEVKKQLLDFDRSQKEPYLEEIRVMNLNVSKTARSAYGKTIFYVVYFGMAFLLQALLIIILIIKNLREMPPNIYLVELQEKKTV
mgnify:CR=1 FL=1|tara:strand:+ start:4348 stop:5277 length:930 start_codon:yes stop_codon:yes gene_type:complete